MSNANLTCRISAILTNAPQSSLDIWDTLADPSVRRSAVVAELYAMSLEGQARAERGAGEMLYRAPVLTVVP